MDFVASFAQVQSAATRGLSGRCHHGVASFSSSSARISQRSARASGGCQIIPRLARNPQSPRVNLRGEFLVNRGSRGAFTLSVRLSASPSYSAEGMSTIPRTEKIRAFFKLSAYNSDWRREFMLTRFFSAVAEVAPNVARSHLDWNMSGNAEPQSVRSQGG